ncbi:MAG: HDOD domain-containing protein [Bryobacterales bacterium]|nr:HDOD domain-containing protein [Bryobacteraceae bacterium]MDW8355416.1 HDOD domain-containing protein [Bryobacterales bacterium]
MSGSQPEVMGKDLPALSKIPAFPPIVLRVLDLASDEEVDVRKLVELITADTALSAQILRLANSPLFGLTARVDSLQHALVVLGLRRMHNLAMTAATSNYLRSALRTRELHRCWLHSLASALLSAELARLFSQPEDSAYTAGLLHDIGRLGLLVAHPEDYTKLLRQLAEAGGDPLELERQAFGIDHCEAGEILAQRWGLPQEIQRAARQHHQAPGEDAGPDSLLWFSCQMADALGYWAVPSANVPALEWLRDRLPIAVRERLPVDPQYWKQMIEERLRAYDVAVGDGIQAAEILPATAEAPLRAAHDTAAPAPPPSELVSHERPERSLSGDLAIVATTSLVFTAVFFLMLYLMNRG